MPKAYANRAVSQFRIDLELFNKLKAIAEKESRTMNSQLEYFIKQGVERYESEHGPVEVPEESED